MYLQNSVEALIFFISNGDVKEIFHNLQAYIFKSKGYEKTNCNVPYHSKGELGNVDQFFIRLLDLCDSQPVGSGPLITSVFHKY